MFGVDAGVPILNPGEAAIVAMGAMQLRPWEFEGAVALRQVVTLSLAFDHRLVDGRAASLFLSAVGEVLGDPTNLLALELITPASVASRAWSPSRNVRSWRSKSWSSRTSRMASSRSRAGAPGRSMASERRSDSSS